ncbi:MAG: hypothetical protein P1P69_02325 [Methanosarcinaceae archaeon]|nr:hypothetical protein [Methanosarcinaceae archaeon]MDF1533324.1 hypothetical protein [Methanosarcinaceae archaeon]
MNVLVAFGIGALVFIFIVILTAYFLKSALFLESATNKSYATEAQEHVDDAIDDRVDDDQDTSEIMSEES